MLEYEQIADRLAADRPGRVLDWGCGAGQMTSLLRARGLDVTAYDWRPGVPEPVVRPLEHYPEVHAHISSEPVKLPFDDRSFDAVLSCGVLEHVHDPDGSLEELKRVLAPGGTFYVYKLPNRSSYLEAIARVANRLGAPLYFHGKARVRPHLRRARGARAARAPRLPRARARPGQHAAADAAGRDRAAADAGDLVAQSARSTRVPGLRRLATNVELVADAPA